MLCKTVGFLAAAGLLASIAAPPPTDAQQVATSQNISITVRGIFSGTLFAQDADFALGNGQKAEWVAAERDKWVHGGDVRNMRLTFGLTGPEIKRGWRGNATVELDFFGLFPGATATTSGGAFGDEQAVPRLRLAFVDLTSGRTTIRFGQDWSPTLGNIPQSTSHIGFPLGWGSGGFIGWRFTQVKLIQTLSKPGAPTTTRLQLAVMANSWSDEPNGADNQFNAGERGLPQLEGRLDFSKARWSGYVVAHVDSKDSINVAGDDLTSWAVEAGFSTTRGDLSLQGNAHIGTGMGHQFAQIAQFGDIQGWGAWGQVGYTLNPRWSVWGYYGAENPDDADVTAAGSNRARSWLFVPMLRYRSGPYAYGIEWLHNETLLTTGTNLEGNQVLLSVRYDF
jgi:hypothetical protein